MAQTFYDYGVDPWNNDAPTYINVKSVYYGGTLPDMIASGNATFPPGAATRIFISFPYVIDVSDLNGTRPCSIRDVTNGVNLTRVTGTPGVNEYRLPTAASVRRNVIEANVTGCFSYGFNFYTLGGVIDAFSFNNINVTGVINADLGYRCLLDNFTTLSNEFILERFYSFGTWNMDSTGSINVAHHLSDFKLIHRVQVLILNTAKSASYPLDYSTAGTDVSGNYSINATNIVLTRIAGGFFDHADFNAASGYLIITHRNGIYSPI